MSKILLYYQYRHCQSVDGVQPEYLTSLCWAQLQVRPLVLSKSSANWVSPMTFGRRNMCYCVIRDKSVIRSFDDGCFWFRLQSNSLSLWYIANGGHLCMCEWIVDAQFIWVTFTNLIPVLISKECEVRVSACRHILFFISSTQNNIKLFVIVKYPIYVIM